MNTNTATAETYVIVDRAYHGTDATALIVSHEFDNYRDAFAWAADEYLYFWDKFYMCVTTESAHLELARRASEVAA